VYMGSDIKLCIKEIGWFDVACIDLTQDRS
jgi:hypothetical protein